MSTTHVLTIHERTPAGVQSYTCTERVQSFHAFVYSLKIACNDTEVVYRQALYTIFRIPIYPMLNQWNTTPMTPNIALWLVDSNEDSYEY